MLAVPPLAIVPWLVPLPFTNSQPVFVRVLDTTVHVPPIQFGPLDIDRVWLSGYIVLTSCTCISKVIEVVLDEIHITDGCGIVKVTVTVANQSLAH